MVLPPPSSVLSGASARLSLTAAYPGGGETDHYIVISQTEKITRLAPHHSSALTSPGHHSLLLLTRAEADIIIITIITIGVIKQENYGDNYDSSD